MRMLSGVAVGAGVEVGGVGVAVAVWGIGVGDETAVASRVGVNLGWQAERRNKKRGSIFFTIGFVFKVLRFCFFAVAQYDFTYHASRYIVLLYKNYVNREDFAQYREIYLARRGAN